MKGYEPKRGRWDARATFQKKWLRSFPENTSRLRNSTPGKQMTVCDVAISRSVVARPAVIRLQLSINELKQIDGQYICHCTV